MLEGTIRINMKGVGFVDNAEGNSVQIDALSLNTALNRDTVKVELLEKVADRRTGEMIQMGKVVEVLKRNKMEFVGVLEQDNGLFFLIPDDQKMYMDIAITKEHLNSAEVGQKVLARITKWEDPKKNPLGEVLEIIGKPGDNDVEMQTIVLEKGFRPTFPPEVEAEAKAIEAKFPAELVTEAAKRRDFRNILTMTIDPADAKDFDDALSFERLSDGSVEVGVHIADVSHYVTPGSALDDEAKKRGTSIYLVDRTIPMLPEILSNEICSLMPEVERLTFSAVFTFNQAGEVIKDWYGKTIIKSDKRFSYEEAEEIIQTKAGAYAEELAEMNRIAKVLREQKFAAGAIAFEEDEVKFKLDEKGKPIEVYKKVRGDSNKMIEDYMLLANRKVAEHVAKLNPAKENSFVYRIHDLPDMEKIEQLATFLKPLGYKLKVEGDTISSTELNKLLAQAQGKAEETMINRATVKTMAKAVYSMNNIGHYGLAFEYYTHFTSPIRRYPDVMVHRLLDIYLRGEQPSKEMVEEYSRLVIYSSDQEKLATEAERDSIKYKQVEYMETRIGQVFDGVISGISPWGIYIEELETKCEGMAKLRDLKDDFYEFDEKQYALVGQKTGKKYRLGDRVRVKVAAADLQKKMIDYSFV